ncbi:MAG: DUF2399 domain-containing protein [Treponemataceae bacterium]
MERAILESFAARYPSSAQRRGGKPLRLRDWESTLPGAFASAAARLSFLDAMERLERAGILRLIWAKRRVGDELSAAELSNPRALYERLGFPLPDDQAMSLSETAAAVAAAAELRGDFRAAAFFRFTALKADALSDRLTAEDLKDMAALFALDRKESDRLPIRALSIKLYRDSKRLEKLTAALRPVLQQSVRTSIGSDIDALTLPERIYPEVAVGGNARLIFEDGAVWALAGRSTALSLPAAETLVGIRGASAARVARALSIENKETFHAFAHYPMGFDFVLCSGGRPNRAVRAVLRVLAASGFDVFHAGDLDPDGIAILAEIAELSGARPFGMDAAIFDRYMDYARDLDGPLVARLKSVPPAALELPGIRALADRIRTTRKGVEQEIIDYVSCPLPFFGH